MENVKELIISSSEIKCCETYIMPLIGIDEEFINIDDIVRVYIRNDLKYLIIHVKEGTNIEALCSLPDSNSFGNGKFISIGIDEQYKDDIIKLLNGEYSYVSNDGVKNIIRNTQLTWDVYEGSFDPLLGAILPDSLANKEMRRLLSNYFNYEITGELLSKPNLDLEYWITNI